MGRRSMKHCLLCASEGIKDSKAIARYYNPKILGTKQYQTGWIPVCEMCLPTIQNVGGFTIEYYNSADKPVEKEFPRLCNDGTEHKLTKNNLMSMEDKNGIYDVYKCEKCGVEVRRYLRDLLSGRY